MKEITRGPIGRFPRFQVSWLPLTVGTGPLVEVPKVMPAGKVSVTIVFKAVFPVTLIVKV